MSAHAPDPRLAVLLRHPAVRRAAEVSRGIPCHIVGGAIRDALLERPFRDLDLVVESDGAGVAARLSAALPARLVELGGERFAAFRLVAADIVIDLWDRRRASLDSDLARRDLTVNACALDVVSAELSDPMGGLRDIDSRILRACRADAFTDDPARIVRLPRLLARLEGFSLDAATLELGRGSVAAIGHVATERVRDELELLFRERGFTTAVPCLVELRLYPGLWLGSPGLAATAGRYPAAAEGLERSLDLAAQTAPSSCAGSTRSEALDRAAARQALAFLELPRGITPGGPEAAETRDSFAAREAAIRRADEFRRGGLMKRATAVSVRRLIATPAAPGDEAESRRFLHRLGPLWREGLCLLGLLDPSLADPLAWSAVLSRLARLAAEEGSEIFAPRRLLTGHEITTLVGIEPGPRLGRAIQALLRAQVEGRVRTREQALALLRGEPPAPDRSSGSS